VGNGEKFGFTSILAHFIDRSLKSLFSFLDIKGRTIMATNRIIESLVKNKIFANEEDVMKELVQDYIVRQTRSLKREVTRFERKYGMPFERFKEYLHERSELLERSNLSHKAHQSLAQSIMQEEDDWLDWKAAKEMLESWIGLR